LSLASVRERLTDDPSTEVNYCTMSWHEDAGRVLGNEFHNGRIVRVPDYEIRHESTCFGIVARVQFGCDTPGLSGRRVLRGCGWGTQTRTTHLLKRTSWNLQVPQQVRTIDQCEQMCSLLGGSSGGGVARCRPHRNPVTAAAATLPVVLYRCSIEASIEALRLR